MRPTLRVLLVACLVAVAAAESSDAETRSCTPWPGEPDPLPGVEDADAFLARFASLRTAELVSAGREAERTAPARAHRYFEHALCIDRRNADALQGKARTEPLRIHHPNVLVTRKPAAESAARLDRLGAAVRVVTGIGTRAVPEAGAVGAVSAAPPRPVARERAAAPADWRRTDASLARAEASVRDARFEAALDAATQLRAQLARASAVEGVNARRARAEVVAGTAEVALGREAEARRSFERAHAADPALELDPSTTSPKVKRVFDAAREQRAGLP